MSLRPCPSRRLGGESEAGEAGMAEVPPALSLAALPAGLQLATYFVDSGRVVPGLKVDPDGRLRAQWWPLPAAGDRELLAAHLTGDSLEEQQQLAESLADAVDRLVRQRLEGSAAQALRSASRRRRGPPALPQAWLAALEGPDPHLAATADLAAEAALVTGLHQWVREGAC